MFIRVSTKRRGANTYRYAQLVESYRREDGRPTHRICGNLGELPELAIENLKVALRAARGGKAVVIPKTSPCLAELMQIQANLRYLDVAVVLELWRAWGLDEILSELLPSTPSAAPAADVVAVMTLQRCLDPGSKLYCQRWLPTTALPELLDIPSELFNNTRMHRVLDQLHAATPRLQERLIPGRGSQGFGRSRCSTKPTRRSCPCPLSCESFSPSAPRRLRSGPTRWMTSSSASIERGISWGRC